MSRISLGRAHVLASSVMRELWSSGAEPLSLSPVGSLRRFAPDIGDVSLLAAAESTRHAAALLDAFSTIPAAKRTTAKSSSAATIATERGEITLHVAAAANAGVALVCLTGSREHVSVLAAIAETRELQLSPGHLFDSHRNHVPCETEEELYARLGLQLIPPELRQGTDEFDAARERRIPHLLTDLNIRGDLHMHSFWSDGRDSIDEMVRASRALGYEYVAMTDHSARARAGRTLSLENVLKQRAEVRQVESRNRGIHVLHGIEVEILPDGSLDFDDEVLAGFDIVLASLHDHADHPRERLLDRYLSAIESPFVDIITHPANRTPAAFEGYDLDFDRIFEAAIRTGTAMEVDGSPSHLDMDGSLARRAAAAGVTIVVNSDSHWADALGRQMRFGVGTARRGWIEPAQVLNTRGVAEIRAFAARQRARARA